MQDFSNGVELGGNEDEYQAALREYRDGLVVGLNPSRKGQFTLTMLHAARCRTIWLQRAARQPKLIALERFCSGTMPSLMRGSRPSPTWNLAT